MQETKQLRLSESFPPDSQKNSVYLANVHKILQDSSPNSFDLRNICIRPLKSRKEMDELQLLHKEWFPINYSSDYFEAVANGKNHGLIAELKFTKSNRLTEKVIVGCIFFDIRLARRKYMCISFSEYFKEYKSIYIMTIGVINEFRKQGIATLLLKEAIKQTLEKENTYLKYVYLHVVEYNHSAQKFYEKNQFLKLKIKKKHYLIEGKYYDAWVYVLYMNGTKQPLTYYEFISIIVHKINIFTYISQCFRSFHSVLFGRNKKTPTYKNLTTT